MQIALLQSASVRLGLHPEVFIGKTKTQFQELTLKSWGEDGGAGRPEKKGWRRGLRETTEVAVAADQPLKVRERLIQRLNSER